ncbi:MAG: hypothetical protein ACOC5L_01145 [Halobacteriota archaeon]
MNVAWSLGVDLDRSLQLMSVIDIHVLHEGDCNQIFQEVNQRYSGKELNFIYYFMGVMNVAMGTKTKPESVAEMLWSILAVIDKRVEELKDMDC